MFVQSDEFSQRNTRRFALDSAHVLSWFTILCFLTYLSYIVFFVPSKVSLVSRTEDISSPRMYCKIHNPIEHLHGMNPSRRNNQPSPTTQKRPPPLPIVWVPSKVSFVNSTGDISSLP